MGEFQHMDDRIGIDRYPGGIFGGFITLNHARPVISPRHPAHDPDRLGLVVTDDQDREPRTTDIALDCRLPTRILDLDVIAEHMGVRRRTLLPDGLNGTLDKRRITDLIGFEPGDLAPLLIALRRQHLVTHPATVCPLGELITVAAVALFVVPEAVPAIVRRLHLVQSIETVRDSGNGADRITLHQVVDIGKDRFFRLIDGLRKPQAVEPGNLRHGGCQLLVGQGIRNVPRAPDVRCNHLIGFQDLPHRMAQRLVELLRFAFEFVFLLQRIDALALRLQRHQLLT